MTPIQVGLVVLGMCLTVIIFIGVVLVVVISLP
jgi:hypothetical protein